MILVFYKTILILRWLKSLIATIVFCCFPLERRLLDPWALFCRVCVGGEWYSIPTAPLKYDKFLRARASIFREISNMLQLSEHPNILRLHEVGTWCPQSFG